MTYGIYPARNLEQICYDAYEKSEYAFSSVQPTLLYSGRGGRGGAGSSRSAPLSTLRSAPRARCCSAALAVAAAFAALTVLAVAVLAFYMGALRTDGNDPVIAFECRMRVSRGDVYSASLSRVGGAAWKERARRYTSALRAVYAAAGSSASSKAASVASAFAGAQVTGFGDGQLDVHFRLYLDRRKMPSSIPNVEDALKDIIVQDMLSRRPIFGQIKVDPSSIVIERDRNHTYHSETLSRDLPIEAVPMPPPSSTIPQINAKEKTVHTRMGVVRKTTIKPNYSSTTKKKTSPPNDEPEINTENLPVIQGTFQITKTDADITENNHKIEAVRVTDIPNEIKPKPGIAEKHISLSNQTINNNIGSNLSNNNNEKNKTPITTEKATTITIRNYEPFIDNKMTNTDSKTPEILLGDNPLKRLPEIDSLFIVSPTIDDQPWKPIEPGSIFSSYTSTSKKPTEETPVNAEDRMGEAEVVEDIASYVTETLNEDSPPDWNSPGFTNAHYNDNVPFNLQSNSYNRHRPVNVIYSSFTDAAFSPTFEETETLGSNYPKPYPIPVDKIKSEKMENYSLNVRGESTSVDNVISPATPKDKFSSVSINVVRPEIHLGNEEFVHLNGGIIAKRHNTTGPNNTSLSRDDDFPINEETNNSNYNHSKMHYQFSDRFRGQTTSSKIQPTWEFVNGTDLKDKESIRTSPSKIYNQTLQAVVIKNEDPIDRPPAKLSNRVTIIRNISTIFNKLASTLGFDPQPLNKIFSKISNINNSLIESKVDIDFTQSNNESQLNEASSNITTTLPEITTFEANKIVTLLPAKSNSGVNRPLRPRPLHLRKNDSAEERSFTNLPFVDEVREFMNNLNDDEDSEEDVETLDSKENLKTPEYSTYKPEGEIQQSSMYSNQNSFTNDHKSFDDSNLNTAQSAVHDLPRINYSSTNNNFSNKYAINTNHKDIKSTEVKNSIPAITTNTAQVNPLNKEIVQNESDNLEMISIMGHDSSTLNKSEIKNNSEIYKKENVTSYDLLKNDDSNKTPSYETSLKDKHQNVPEGAYKVEVHVSSSISTSFGEGPNKTIIEITRNNGSNDNINHTIVDRLTAEKLRHLASLATITDFNNNTFFNPASDLGETVISTKAVSSSYNVNHAGFKILTKTFNKVSNNLKDDEKIITNNFKENKQKNNMNVIQATNTSSECDESSFRCSSGLCLLSTARCNRLLDCPNGEDETGCSCADYLRSEFLLRKICDGVVDCWDFSDENNCDWCEPGKYVCSNSRQCIDKKQVCDGKKDCPQGDDERLCVTVALSEQAASSLPYNNEGYLMVQKNGKWGRLCMQNFDEVISRSRSSLKATDLGRAVCRAMTYNDYKDIVRVIEEPNEKVDSNYYELKYNSRPSATQTSLTFSPSTCSTRSTLRVSCGSLECGIRPQAVNQQASGVAVRRYRIVGGGNAGAGAWPWQAALYKEGDFQCGGTLVSDRWLVSAGHCFYRAQDEYWVARLGALRRGTSFPSPYEQLRPLDSINLHPGYMNAGFINDIALLRTQDSVHFTDYVRPICLPPASTDVEDGRTCTVIGWGQLFEVGRLYPDTLQEVELPIISTGECRKRTLFLPLYRVTDDMFCAGFDRGGRDACLGDSGGPLMCQDNDNHWYLYGVTSNGYGCARADRPGVYTKVANYMSWIDSSMRLYDDENETSSVQLGKSDLPSPGNSTSPSDLETAETVNRSRKLDSKCKGHRCPLGECLPPSQICNGFMECGDGSDEIDCER